MFIGALGFGLSLMFWESWGGLEGSEYDQIALRVRPTPHKHQPELRI